MLSFLLEGEAGKPRASKMSVVMEDMNVITCLAAYCTKISDTIQLMNTCHHAPTKGVPFVCGICITVQTRLGLISEHLGLLQDEELEFLGPYVERTAHDLLHILWEMCSVCNERALLVGCTGLTHVCSGPHDEHLCASSPMQRFTTNTSSRLRTRGIMKL
jgi:hypothetical protein